MIICETIGLFVTIWVCSALIIFLFSVFVSGSPDKIDVNTLFGSYFAVITILLLIASILFVQFRHHPEQFGYTAIEEVEETAEETE